MGSESYSESRSEASLQEEKLLDRVWNINIILGGAYKEPTPKELEDCAASANSIAAEIIKEQHTELHLGLEQELSFCFEHIIKRGLADKTPALKALVGHS